MISLLLETYEECLSARNVLIDLLVSLGFSVKWNKVIGPTQRVTFLGLIIDSIYKWLKLPVKKLQMLLNLIHKYCLRAKMTKKELQVLVGHISCAAKVIYGARTLSRLFIDVPSKLKRPHEHVRLTRLLQHKLQWWNAFAKCLNGLCHVSMGKTWPTRTIRTDASFSGFGAVLDGMFLAGTWDVCPIVPTGLHQNWLVSPYLSASLRKNINFLELIAACLPLLI